ncbi:hypothetical protein GGI04_000464 [Coemansia thaxteri]|nr:hypothetical protein GGI04_000464 [Coemansia thaxteri]
MLHSSSAAFADEADIAAAVTTFSIRPLDPTLLRPKAARLLGLAPMPLATKHTKETNDGCDARGPDVSPSKWVPDWPEPDAEYVANMMRRRTPPQPQSQSFHHEALNMEDSDDPLVVWQQPARLPALAGVPRGAGNGWMRVQGLQPPYDPLFILQWTASLLLTGTYAALIRPLTESMPAISLAALNPPPPALDMCASS